MSKFAWVTLTTNDTYSLGALVLAHSLRRTGTAHQLAVLVTPAVSEAMRQRLQDVYNVVQEVNVLDSQDAANLALLARPELGITFTKLHCWRLVQFEKCVFLDADTLVLQNSDELFEREELSAAPDVSWPDCFNSGVFVYRPSLETFSKITEFAVKNGSFDGGDQGLLNLYFGDWAQSDIKKHLPFTYNVAAFASYCYLPAFKQFRDKIKILHFAGKLKPWLIQFNSENRTALTPTEYAHAADLIQLWWNIFCDNVHQKLSDNMCGAIAHYFYHYQQQQPAHQQQHDHYHHHYEHEQHQHHHQNRHEHSPSPTPNFYEFGKIKEFSDPWEDYYENLSRERSNSNENNEQQIHEQDWQQPAAEPAPEWPDRETETGRQSSQIGESEWSQAQNEAWFEETQPQQQQPPQDHQAQRNKPIEQQHYEHESHESHVDNERQEQQSTNPATSDPHRNVNVETTTEKQPTVYEANIHKEDTAQKQEQQQQEQEQQDYLSVSQIKTTDATNLDTVSPRCSTDKKEAFHKKGVNERKTKSKNKANEAGLAGALSQLRLGAQRTPEQEAYEQLMRRQCWESGQIDYAGRDSFENIWKKISQTLESKPSASPPKEEEEKSELLTSADIEDGKVEVDPVTKARTEYKVIDGGYEVRTTTPQPNGTLKTAVRTFWDPKPVSEEDAKREAQNKREIRKRFGKEVRIDKKTTMLTREIEGGYEEVYTTVNDDGTRSTRTKTFFDSVPAEIPDNTNAPVPDKNKRKALVKKSSVDSTDSTESRRIVQRTDQKQGNFKQETTVEESRRVVQSSEFTENNRTVRKNSVQEQNIRQITSSSGGVDTKDKKKKKTKSNIPPPPPDFIENETTTVSSKRVPHGVEYTYSTKLESGKTITTSKTVYEEEESELTEEEIRAYKKTLKDAEKHKNVTTTKKLRSESGTKKIVPSENPGDVTTVETIQIEGGTEFHYTTVTAEGIVKKSVKTVYDPVQGDEETEEEIVEEYEEEIIEPGEKNVRTIETVKQLPKKFEEEVTVTHEKVEKKVKKSMMISH